MGSYVNVPNYSFSETPGAENGHSHNDPNRDPRNTYRHAQSHHWFTVRPGHPHHQGGAVHQDGHPRHIPAEQKLPAVVRHLGQAGSKHTRYFTEERY